MDTNATISLALGVGTILASGITSAVVTSWLNRRKDQAEFMRTKAEALYLAADEYGRTLATQAITYYPVIKGEISWNQMLDIQIKNGSQKREHGGSELMTMLLEIYFPSVRQCLKNVFSSRDNFNNFITSMKQSYIQNDGHLNPNEWMPHMNGHAIMIDNSIKHLQEAIVVAARSYAGVRQA